MALFPSLLRRTTDSRAVVTTGGHTLVARRDPNSAAYAIVGAFESETQAVIVRTSPRHEHTVLLVLLGMLVLALLLMSVAKLDRIVPSSGLVVPTGGSLFISPLDKALIRDVRVRAGDIVKKGQVLAVLDPTFANADLAQLQQKLQSDEAEVARLQAEHDDKPYNSPGTSTYDSLQSAIHQQRLSEYRSAVADFDARIKNSEASLAQYQRDVQEYGKRLGVATELEHMNVTLEQHGWGSKVRTLASTDSRVEIGRQRADAESQILQNRETIASLKAQRGAYIDKWHSDVGKDLVTSRNDLDKVREDLKKAQRLSQLSSLNAPEDAVVLKVGKISAGSVTDSAGQGNDPLFTLVPLDAPVEVEVHVAAADIGFIQPGDPVEIKLAAYRFLEHGTAKGVIKTISEGSFTTDDNNLPVEPYFKVRIRFTDVSLRNVPANFRLVPGMTVSADIKVGRRTVLSYLVEGALRTGSEAMREP